ncbi:RDD family protein [Streptomyces sp. NPDC102467]|uniref:RDD family protein n=1 Tax=Streptomyces sp. NPDC102467 TaxID=3366179 RepID=UPI00380BE8A1
MSAPTPAPGDDRPREGYYPDPSIPGYVRYWNGAAWVPGTSRPAPSEGETLPTPAGSAPAAAPVEETGPVFLDEEPSVRTETGPDEPVSPEPASAWAADTARQSGFGGEQDRRVSWGGEASGGEASGGEASGGEAEGHTEPAGHAENPATPATPATPAAPATPEAPAAPAPERSDGTVAIRAVRPGGAGTSPRTDGTMTIRAVPQQGSPQQGARPPAQPQPQAQPQAQAQAQPQPQAPAQSRAGLNPQRAPSTPAADPRLGGAQPQASTPAPAPAQTPPPAYGYPAPAQPAPGPTAAPAYGYPGPAQQAPGPTTPPAYGYPGPERSAAPAVPTPVTQGPGGGSPSWAQQVHQLAEPEGPVTPFKPVVNDPFLAAAQAQASARPAGLGKRFVARLIDTLVLGAVTAAVAVPLGTRALDHIDGKIDAAKASGRQVTVWLLDGTTATYLGIVLAVLLLFGVVYEALPTAKWGHTLGKKLMGLRVREIEGSDSPTFGAALRRWLAYSVLGVLVIGILGVLWGAIDRPWRQCLHDKVARTFVSG